MNSKETIPTAKNLQYKKGELIIKEGNFGIAVYRIVSGKVRIYTESKEGGVFESILGPGKILGDMTFWHRANEPYLFSAVALEDTDLEVWHLQRLLIEYERISPIMRYLSDQTLKRIKKMNKLLIHLNLKKDEKERDLVEEINASSLRLFYRRKLDLDCLYQPCDHPSKGALSGRIKDISLGGVGLEVMSKNTAFFPHKIGVEFHLETDLPNGQRIDFIAKIVSAKKEDIKGKLLLGMSLTNISDESGKRLGFFMLPG